MSGNDELRNSLKVLSRLFFRPLRRTGSKGFKVKRAVRKDVAAITAGVTEPVLQENWLDSGFENIEIEMLRSRIFARRLWRVALAPGWHDKKYRRHGAREQRPL